MKHSFDEVIHAPNRLAICAMLSSVEAIEFGAIRDELGVSDSVASKHLKVLTDAGYISFESKPDELSKRPRSWISFTAAGASAFNDYVALMQRLIAGSGSIGDLNSETAIQAT